jgi:hypothetical protein
MQRPEHHHPAKKLDPAMAKTTETYPGHGDPGLSNKEQMEHTAGQPDKWPQRPDVPVKQNAGPWPLFGGKIAD